MTRFARFNVVGAIGFALQLIVLSLLERAGWPLVPATIVAVEAAVLHNFVWHERWTWADATAGPWRGRLARFHATNGLVSLAGNALVTAALVEARVPVAIASACAVAACAVANFALARSVVFCATTWPIFDGHLQ